MSDKPNIPDRDSEAVRKAQEAREAERAARRARQAERKYEPAFKGVVKRDRSKPQVTWQERHAKQAELDAARSDGRSHFRARLELQTRHRGKDALATLLLMFVGIATLMAILSQQNTSLPGWVPIYGEDVIHLEGELDAAQGVTPGQGQAVMMSGIQVGLIDSVYLEDGIAVVGMDVDAKYAPIVREDATILLRPRTNLNDMTIQIDPGDPNSAAIEDGTRITLADSASNVQPDQFFNALDADTRAYLKLLVQGGAEGLEGNGKKLSSTFRRFEPFTRFVAKLNGELAKRREAIARSIHNFRVLTVELGRNGDAIEDFVSSSAGALEGFANRQADIQDALRELPSTLTTTRRALDNANRYATSATTTLADLVPQAEALGPGLAASRELFEDTRSTLANQVRPFARQVRPVLVDAASSSPALEKTVTKFGDSLNSLNYGFNALAFDPGAKPGNLFYLPWLNHNINANYLEDGGGTVRRGALLLTCRAANLADGFVLERPSLRTVQQATNAPTGFEICPPTTP